MSVHVFFLTFNCTAVGERIGPLSFKTGQIESPIGKKAQKAIQGSPSTEKLSPNQIRLQGKIGDVDAEVIEQALDRFKYELAVVQEECKQKEELLKAISPDTTQLASDRLDMQFCKQSNSFPNFHK